MISKLFAWIIKWAVRIVGTFLDILLDMIPLSITPNLNTVTGVIVQLYNLFFDFFNYLRNAFLIDNIALNLIIEILTIKYLIKPTISLVKIVIHWFTDLKG